MTNPKRLNEVDHESYKDRVDRFILYITEAHGENTNVGDSVTSERTLSIITGLARSSIREAFAVLQYHGFVSCDWGKEKVFLKNLTEFTNVKI